MIKELIENPKFDANKIPRGWERVLTGEIIEGDQLLVGHQHDSNFMPCVKSDGTNIATMSSGSWRVEGIDDLVAYKAVIIREVTSKEVMFLNTMKTKLPSFININQNTRGTIAKGTSIYDISLSSNGFLCNNELRPSALLIELIEKTSESIFNIKPVFCHENTEFYIKG